MNNPEKLKDIAIEFDRSCLEIWRGGGINLISHRVLDPTGLSSWQAGQ
jgi:hypothetical protein